MSLQAARDFVKKAVTTKELQDEAHARTKDIVDVGRDHGFEFTRDELRQAMKEHDVEAPKDDPDTCICFF